MANMPDWITRFPGAVTVSDRNHVIVYMNDKAAATFKAYGGKDLVGTDLMACHQERSRGIIERLLSTGSPNVYTIDKKGVKKLIYQSAWYEDGAAEPAGLVELSLELPADMPHYVRS